MRRLSRRTCDGCTARRPSTDNAVAILALLDEAQGSVGRRCRATRQPLSIAAYLSRPHGVAACRKSSHCLS
jgi:hypothetical protein